MSNFFSNIPTTVRQVIAFVTATLILLYAIGIFSAQLQIIVIVIALFVMLKSFITLGGMAKVIQLLGSKNNDSTKKSDKDNGNDIF